MINRTNGGRRSLIGRAAAALLGLSEATGARAAGSASGRLPVEGELASFAGATGWLNSPPRTTMDLRGKVVLVDFWTLTCINWLRTLPYIRAWAAKYRPHGLVVIGAHTPEFSFEQEIDNVRRATEGFGLDYPIAVDSRYAVWRAFQNQYWPALYLADAQGRLRYHHFGEGEYEQSERSIQALLREAGRADVPSDLVSVEGTGVQAAADWATLQSAETYIGYAQAERFAPPGGIRKDAPNPYQAVSLPPNSWGLAGRWTVGSEFAALNEASGRVVCRFHARDLHMVLAPSTPGTVIRFRVELDGAAPAADHGADVDAAGSGSVREGRLYQLVRQSGTVGDRTFAIQFLDPGVRAFVFTFG